MTMDGFVTYSLLVRDCDAGRPPGRDHEPRRVPSLTVASACFLAFFAASCNNEAPKLPASLPSVSDIARISIVCTDDHQVIALPESVWDEVIAPFESAQLDHEPRQWECMNWLLIVYTRWGKAVFVHLFRTNDVVGAIAIENDNRQRTYYRVSNDASIFQAITNAIEHAK